MSPITKIRVAKGVSRPSNPQDPASEWIKTFYEIEGTLGMGDNVDEVKEYLEKKIVEWLGQVPIEEIRAIPEIDIESLPWKTFKTKEPCKAGEAGWILGPASRQGPPEGAEQLVEALDKSDGKLGVGPYTIQYSRDKAFIQRLPTKRKGGS